ncbi:spermidine/putrescine ABC transporter substrate-binding protein [Alsobacter soli]|uniref:Spermidine/putrescine ABC transporter substrate-binding protein n=1 Tax=Alsobacter soli TaxID=2109933 RepID=A0A2T1HTU0_9HYPH|nr:extracellular solute-binding protein [Alsobacter soli]PSC04949.1 spermidine/putrescine ABC transporter substrate-binding protein [Alsobacter soli]
MGAPDKAVSRRFAMRLVMGAVAAPAILRASDALSTSGRVQVYAWQDFFDKNTILADFEAATGIKVELSVYGSNEELEARLTAAGGRGYDLVFPSVDTAPNYYRLNLLQPIDEGRFSGDRVIPSIYRTSVTLGAAHRGRRYLIPFDWGTEGVTYDSRVFPVKSGELSYGMLWDPKLGRKALIRPKSVLTGVALYLDAAGRERSNRGMDMYRSEGDCRRVMEASFRFMAERRGNIGAQWNDAAEATRGFTQAGCVIGQTWDTTGVLLHRAVGAHWRYGMPREGGLGWTDTLAIPAGAANLDQAYALIDHLMKPQTGAQFSESTGYNSCASGAEMFLSPAAKASFEMIYPNQKVIDDIWWWPMQTEFFRTLRAEYAAKIAAL